jgi:Bacteriophage holin family
MTSLQAHSALKYIAAALVSFLGLFAPVKGMLIAAGALCIADLVTGVLAAHARKEPITSSKLRRTVVKLLVYELTIVFSFVTQHWLTGDSFPLVSWASGMVGLVELKSVLENLNAMSGQDLLKSVLDKLTAAQTKPEP